jgi:large subunit ribosomal protein L19
MTHIAVQALERKLAGKKIQILRPGYKVRIHQKIKEGEKERIQIFEGMVIGLNAGHGVSKTVTVRKMVQGIGVEKVFPLASPNVTKIEVVKTFGVRRAKLYYMRDEKGLSTRLRGKLGLIEKDVKHGDKEKSYDNENAEEAIAETATAATENTESSPAAEQAEPAAE